MTQTDNCPMFGARFPAAMESGRGIKPAAKAQPKRLEFRIKLALDFRQATSHKCIFPIII